MIHSRHVRSAGALALVFAGAVAMSCKQSGGAGGAGSGSTGTGSCSSCPSATTDPTASGSCTAKLDGCTCSFTSNVCANGGIGTTDSDYKCMSGTWAFVMNTAYHCNGDGTSSSATTTGATSGTGSTTTTGTGG
jgi:hypothetical protein